jgi:uncharacterized membrane protein YqgA involved in biofilm formation
MYSIILVMVPFAAMLLAWLLGAEIDLVLVVVLACIGLVAFAIGIQTRQRLPQDYVLVFAFIVGTICFWLARFDVVAKIASVLK